MNFYKQCVYGPISIMQTSGESLLNSSPELSDRIINSELVADMVRIMACDVPKDLKSAAQPGFSMFLTVIDADETKRLSDGGKISMAVNNGYCILTREFGSQRMLAKH